MRTRAALAFVCAARLSAASPSRPAHQRDEHQQDHRQNDSWELSVPNVGPCGADHDGR
jgi:hypothetical protein